MKCLRFLKLFYLQRQVCLHILAPLHAEILKPSFIQVSVEVTFGVDVVLVLVLYWFYFRSHYSSSLKPVEVTLGVDVDMKLFRLRFHTYKKPHILLKLMEKLMNSFKAEQPILLMNSCQTICIEFK